jgi:hypothetical protein
MYYPKIEEYAKVILYLRKEEYTKDGIKTEVNSDAVLSHVELSIEGYKKMFEFILENIENIRKLEIDLIDQIVKLDLRTNQEKEYDKSFR